MVGLGIGKDFYRCSTVLKQIPWSAYKKFLVCLFTHRESDINTCDVCSHDYFPKGWEPNMTGKLSEENPPYSFNRYKQAGLGENPCPKCGARIQGCPQGEYCSWTECDYVA